MEPIRQVETKDIPNPTFMKLQRPKQADADHPELTLHDMMWRLDATHEKCHWIVDSSIGVIQHLRMDHPPFPQVGPTILPPAHHELDGTGPLGIHHGILMTTGRRERRMMRVSMRAVSRLMCLG